MTHGDPAKMVRRASATSAVHLARTLVAELGYVDVRLPHVLAELRALEAVIQAKIPEYGWELAARSVLWRDDHDPQWHLQKQAAEFAAAEVSADCLDPTQPQPDLGARFVAAYARRVGMLVEVARQAQAAGVWSDLIWPGSDADDGK